MPYAHLVPDDFSVPVKLVAGRFTLRTLTIHDLEKDFEAVTSNVEHLQKVWGNEWPEGLSRDQNLIDLGWHQKEFQRRTSFAYTVVEHNESRVLGCVYIYPTRKKGYDAEVYFWARQDTGEPNLEQKLENILRQWFINDWPFERVAYPGKDMSLEEWEKFEGE